MQKVSENQMHKHCICLFFPGLWGWLEKFTLIFIPLFAGAQFFWLRRKARRRRHQ